MAGRSGPRIASASENAVLVIFRGGVAARFDRVNDGERLLDRRTRRDGVKPPRQVGPFAPLHPEHVVITRPRKRRGVGNGIFGAAQIGAAAEPLFEQIVEAEHFAHVAAL